MDDAVIKTAWDKSKSNFQECSRLCGATYLQIIKVVGEAAVDKAIAKCKKETTTAFGGLTKPVKQPKKGTLAKAKSDTEKYKVEKLRRDSDKVKERLAASVVPDDAPLLASTFVEEKTDSPKSQSCSKGHRKNGRKAILFSIVDSDGVVLAEETTLKDFCDSQVGMNLAYFRQLVAKGKSYKGFRAIKKGE